MVLTNGESIFRRYESFGDRKLHRGLPDLMTEMLEMSENLLGLQSRGVLNTGAGGLLKNGGSDLTTLMRSAKLFSLFKNLACVSLFRCCNKSGNISNCLQEIK